MPAPVVDQLRDDDLVAAAQEHLYPEKADRAAADDVDGASRHPAGRAQHAGERLHPDPVELAELVRQRNDVRGTQPLGEPARLDPEPAELDAGRAVPGEASLTSAARHAVHHGHPCPVVECARHLVAEHRAVTAADPELLEVGAAQAAGVDVHQLALRRAARLGRRAGPSRRRRGRPRAPPYRTAVRAEHPVASR